MSCILNMYARASARPLTFEVWRWLMVSFCLPLRPIVVRFVDHFFAGVFVSLRKIIIIRWHCAGADVPYVFFIFGSPSKNCIHAQSCLDLTTLYFSNFNCPHAQTDTHTHTQVREPFCRSVYGAHRFTFRFNCADVCACVRSHKRREYL